MTHPHKLGESLDALIWGRVQRLLQNEKAGIPLPEEVDHFTDNFGEVVEKLIVLHVRVWFYEDQFFDCYGDDAKLAETKKKMDLLWKKKKPALVAALNRIVDDAIVYSKSLREDSVKKYRGFEEETK